MSIRYANFKPHAEINLGNASVLLHVSTDIIGVDDAEEVTGKLPLEAMVISNSSLCTFMGARSPWANT